MDSSRAFFQIKYGEKLGDRLTLRFPRQNSKIVERLSAKGVIDIPNNITIGYYLQLDDPEGAWCFMPVNTTTAKNLLTVPMVQKRIANDILNRI